MTYGTRQRRPGFPVGAEDTKKDMRDLFRKWGIDQWSIDREREEYTSGVIKRGDGVTVRYLRKTGWQTVYCNRRDYSENLRAIYLFLDRIRIGEKEGVAYQSLSSTKDLVKTAVDTKAEEAENLEDAYDVLGVEPTDTIETIERVYRAKAQSYHPDTATGDQPKMKRLNQAHDLILRSRQAKAGG